MKMKERALKAFSAAALAAVLPIAFTVSAAASRFNSVAQDLSTIGIFRGTENGFELDRAPKRSEAAIMLVRLYGAEEQAKTQYNAGQIHHPFTDVSAYTSPYVAWLYTNGLTKGTTATTFSAAESCSLNNYIVFLLRALGYQDGKDFQYSDAVAFARRCGIDTSDISSSAFLRDDLAALTFRALGAGIKNDNTTLMTSLSSSGAFNGKDYSTVIEKLQKYSESRSGHGDNWEIANGYLTIFGNIQANTQNPQWNNKKDSILNLEINSNVTQMPFRFSGYKNLTSVSIEDGLTEISDNMFSNCGNLVYFQMGSHVKTIGGEAFKNCINLKELTISGNVTNINDSAFDGCKNLKIRAAAGTYAAQFAKEHNIPLAT